MKKHFVILLLAMAVVMPSKAQTSFGLKGGLNLTNMSFDKSNVDEYFKNKAGFFVGPTVKFSLPIVGLGIDAAVLYDQREADIEASGQTTEKLKQQSIQVPINVRYEIGLGQMANVFLFAGPQFGFNIGDKTKEIFNDAAEWRLNSSNFSANVGLGFTLLNHLQLSANYNIALGKTGEIDVKSAASTAWDTATGKAKANSWQVSVAYYF